MFVGWHPAANFVFKLFKFTSLMVPTNGDTAAAPQQSSLSYPVHTHRGSDSSIFYVNLINDDPKKTAIKAKKIPGELEITSDIVSFLIKEDEPPLFVIRRDDIRLIEQIKSDIILLNFFFPCNGTNTLSRQLIKAVFVSEYCLSIIKELLKCG